MEEVQETPQEEVVRSPFAKALYEAMISPGINDLDFWCKMFPPTGPDGLEEIRKKIEGWFTDQSLPTGPELQMILGVIEAGNIAVFMSGLGNLGEPDPDFDAYVERYQTGNELQKQALDRLYEVLDQPIWDSTFVPREQQRVVGSRATKIGSYRYEESLQTLLGFLFAIPVRKQYSVISKIFDVVRKAEEHNFYDDKYTI